jgi:hypothetical protein
MADAITTQRRVSLFISPIAGDILTNKDDLSKKLMQRPTTDELVEKNIMRSDEANGVSSVIVQHKKELEEEKKKDILSRKLSLRPSQKELSQKNILKSSFN